MREEEIKRLRHRCALAEAKCLVHDLERSRSHTALDLRFVGAPRDERSPAWVRLDVLSAELEAARSRLTELEFDVNDIRLESCDYQVEGAPEALINQG